MPGRGGGSGAGGSGLLELLDYPGALDLAGSRGTGEGGHDRDAAGLFEGGQPSGAELT